MGVWIHPSPPCVSVVRELYVLLICDLLLGISLPLSPPLSQESFGILPPDPYPGKTKRPLFPPFFVVSLIYYFASRSGLHVFILSPPLGKRLLRGLFSLCHLPPPPQFLTPDLSRPHPPLDFRGPHPCPSTMPRLIALLLRRVESPFE